MGYNSSTQTIVPDGGISVQDVAKCLGVATLDVGTLCGHPNINKWSKYKPFNSKSVTFTTDDGTSGTYLTDYEKARIAASYGFRQTPSTSKNTVFPEVTFAGSSPYGVNHAYNQFTYHKPRGGANNEIFRLVDFAGYNHRATIGFKMELDSLYYNQVNFAVLYFGMSGPIPGYDSRNCLTPNDILDTLGDRYVCLLFTKEGSTTKYLVSSGKTLSQLKGSLCVILFSGQTMTAVGDTYAIIPALANDWRNQKVTVTAVLAPASGYTDPSVCYDITTGTPPLYSLEFIENIDRKTFTCGQDTSNMDMSQLTRTITASPSASISGIVNDWHYYSNISGLTINVAAGSGWTPTATTLFYKLEIAAGNGGIISTDRTMDNAGLEIVETGTISLTRNGSVNLSHTFNNLETLFTYKELKRAYLAVTLTLSTQPNGEGLSKIFTNEIVLGTWT